MTTLTSRQRLLRTFAHQEPDRIPYDLSSTHVTGISVIAYNNWRRHLGLPDAEPLIVDYIQQVVVPHDDLRQRLGVDTRGLFPLTSSNWNVHPVDDGDHWTYRDEWNLVHRMPKDQGLYFSLVESPLPAADIEPADVDRLAWPDAADPRRIEGLRELAAAYRAEGSAVVLKGLCAGLCEMAERIRGMDNFLVDLLANQPAAERLLDKLLELKLAFWNMALPPLVDLVDVVLEADDFGTQETQLISPELFRRIVKPRQAELIRELKRLGGQDTYILFHSCGSIREIIPDFIEMGIDALNPIHITAAGMEPAGLKRDFGDALVFWGGGVDTQGILPHGTPEQVREDVKRNIEALAPGGGYVFNTVHNIQADVPPQNLTAMWEALQDFGIY